MMPDCLIPAAGFSSRMGAWKPGLRWGDDSMVRKVANAAREAGCRVIVVGGRRFTRIRRIFRDDADILVVRTRRWRRGMGATLRRGIREIRSDRFFVTPADMPLIDAAVYRALAKAFPPRSVAAAACRPSYHGRPGHPVLISSEIIPVFLDVGTSDKGFGGLLGRRGATISLPWEDDGVVTDIDTREEYHRRRPT